MMKAVQLCGLALLICLAPLAFSQTSVTLTGVAGQTYDGIYVSPYYATVGGVTNTPVICDDFADESSLNTTWNASVTSFSKVNSSNTSWGLAGANTSLYGAVGYFANLLMNPSIQGTTQQIIDTFAMWAVFDPQGVEQYLASNPLGTGPLTTYALCSDIFGTLGCTGSAAQVGSLLYNAEHNYSAGQWNMVVISPYATGTSKLCTAESGNCPAQEFIALSMPDGGTAAAYLVLVGLCCVGALFVRSRRRLATPAA